MCIIDKRKVQKAVGNGVVIKATRTTGSTNDDLKAIAAKGAHTPRILFARRQTAGKGRTGHSFYSEGGLYMSVLFPELTDAAPYLTHIAAIAVATAIRETTGLDARIKWVNDVYIGGKKVSGILTESTESPLGRHYVVGIGVNVGTLKGELPLDIRDKAAFFEGDKSELAARISEALFHFAYHFDLDEIRTKYTELLFIVGRSVEVYTSTEGRRATVLGLSPRLGLLVQYEDGARDELISGEIHLAI